MKFWLYPILSLLALPEKGPSHMLPAPKFKDNVVIKQDCLLDGCDHRFPLNTNNMTKIPDDFIFRTKKHFYCMEILQKLNNPFISINDKMKYIDEYMHETGVSLDPYETVKDWWFHQW